MWPPPTSSARSGWPCRLSPTSSSSPASRSTPTGPSSPTAHASYVFWVLSFESAHFNIQNSKLKLQNSRRGEGGDGAAFPGAAGVVVGGAQEGGAGAIGLAQRLEDNAQVVVNAGVTGRETARLL